VAWFAAATAASTEAPAAAFSLSRLSGYRLVMAFTASYTAVWTIAIARLATGVAIPASTTISPALMFQSVITSALAVRAASIETTMISNTIL